MYGSLFLDPDQSTSIPVDWTSMDWPGTNQVRTAIAKRRISRSCCFKELGMVPTGVSFVMQLLLCLVQLQCPLQCPVKHMQAAAAQHVGFHDAVCSGSGPGPVSGIHVQLIRPNLELESWP